jgi:hypothetical protein
LVDEVFLFFGVFSGLVEFGGGGDGGEGFVGKVERELGVLSLEFLGEASNFFNGIAFGAIEPKRQSDDERADAALVDDFGKTGEGIGFVDVDGFHGMRHDAYGIGRSDADAGIAEVDAESGVGTGVRSVQCEVISEIMRT